MVAHRCLIKSMKNTTKIGDITELYITIALTKAGYNVLKPISSNCRYDLVIEFNNKFERVQCKTGQLTNGKILFNTYSVDTKSKIAKSYKNDVDYFGIYCPQTDKCYLMHISTVTNTKSSLRITAPKNNQSKKIVWASDFEITSI